MLCFLGKLTKRKSLKPDLFRRAITRRRPVEDVTPYISPSASSQSEASVDPVYSNSSPKPKVAVIIPSQAIEDDNRGEDITRPIKSSGRENITDESDKPASRALTSKNAEPEKDEGFVPAEALSAEKASWPHIIDAEPATNPISETRTQSSKFETIETSHEPTIDDKDITVRLPTESRSPRTSISKPPVTPDAGKEHATEIPYVPSSVVQRLSLMRRSITPSLSRAETLSTTIIQDDLHISPPSRATPWSPAGASAEHESSPTSDATNELDATDLAPLLDDGAESDETANSARYEGATIGHFSDTDLIDIPQDIHETDKDKVEDNVELKNTVQDIETSVSLAISGKDESEETGHSAIQDDNNQNEPMVAFEIYSPTDLDGESEARLHSRHEHDEEPPKQPKGASPFTKNNEAIAALPIKTTRSSARFSDDTNLLKDFLNRAQAKKMIKDIKMPASEPPAISPRRSPREALSELTSNSPSPQKPRDLASRPGTPPGKQRLDAYTLDDVDELTAEPTSCRRSTRTRFPAPAKTPPGAPSFIPVRRADGADPVVLQKSEAQELAVQTRANTRRNKGQSKPPSVALRHLTAEMVETTLTRMHAHENSKSVGWDERLVYYQDYRDGTTEEGKEEKRPKVRRLRGLGSANGTPAAKRVADVAIPSRTPAPRRRGKGH